MPLTELPEASYNLLPQYMQCSHYMIRKLELNREHFRAIIYYNFQKKLSQQECLAELLSIRRSQGGSTKNVDAVRKLIIEDRHVTYRVISKTSIQKNLHEELGVRKSQKAARVNWCQKPLDRLNSGNSKNVYSIVSGDESWICCYEPENKRQSAVWVFQGEEKPTKVIRSRSVSKKMAATFKITVTADWYTTIFLPKPKKQGKDHTPYSPDLSPNDFFTFPKIKNRLGGQRFQSPEEAVDAFKNAVLDLPANEWNKAHADVY
ncbi:unnamed protein product [Acanthoscelides obtectus]|uniref:Transposase n=1 Tax=Acanthoscelides obtectus TaxID=200917 RepID=A0A9P0Q2H4_ACAOB|nr:unnamed protein product [Acanthoscelides obtectus]CAK1666774.1 hypothetical protein AOBTE_LOCUS25483 [Acanthoscelides obtectus]